MLPLLATVGRAASCASMPGVAISIDDFDLTDGPTMTSWQRDVAIRAALAKHGIKAAGFPAGKNIDRPNAARILRAWSDGGHLLGNHSYSHLYYSGKDPRGTMTDILRCEALLARYPAFRKLYRFPYLHEGRTADERDALRRLLAENDYKPAPVTIDTSDWYIDARLTARLARGTGNPVTAYREYYLSHMIGRALYYDGLAKAIFGRSIDHVILIHHRVATAMFLDNLLEMFRLRGWRLVNADAAFAQPELALQTATLPAGQSLLWSLAKERGVGGPLIYPAEDGAHEKAAMDALEL